MNYTENYQLPQWEEADRVLREDFNTAMAKVDTEIYNTKFANVLERLTTYTTETKMTEINLDISSFDFTNYHELFLYLEPTASTTAERATLLLNHLTQYYGPNNTYTAIAESWLGEDPSRSYFQFRITLRGWISCRCDAAYFTGSQHFSVDGSRVVADLRAENLNSLQIVGVDGQFDIGTKLFLYGIKK